MHPGRPTNEQDRLSLKAAFRRLLKMAGGQEAAELITRGKHQTLNRYGNANEIDCQAPIDVIADLEREVGDLVVTVHLAEMNGFMLVKKSAVAADANLLTHISALAGESGQAVQATVEALADGIDTEAELIRVIKEGEEAVHAGTCLVLAAKARLEALRKNVTPIRGSAAR